MELLRETTASPKHDRHHELVLYAATTGEALLHVTYVTTRDHEWPRSYVFQGASPSAVLADAVRWIDGEAWELCITGFPIGKQFEGKRARVANSLRSRFHRALRDMMGRHAH